MPARRCSACSTHWPNSTEYDPCPLCDERTWYSYSNNPDYTPEEAKAYIAAQREAAVVSAAEPTPEYAHRLARYLEMGFFEVDAHVLAAATWVSKTAGHTYEFPLDWQKVARDVAAGCSHSTCMEVFA